MRKITNNTINFNANALNSSIIVSAIGYAGNGRDGFLFGDDVNFEQLTAYCVLCEANHFELKGWDINCYISEFGEVLPIKALTADDYDQIAAYAKQISSKQPEALRLSDDQIDAYIANAKLEG